MSTPTAHPYLACSFLSYLRLLRDYGFDVCFLPKVLGLGVATALRQPLSTLTHLRYHSRVSQQAIASDPLFIIGHWRSGTTHLQNLMNCDPQFGRVTLLQAAMPGEYLLMNDRVKRWVGSQLPATRLMDNVPVAGDVPWEEELALCASGPHSFYHVSCFPKAMDRIFEQAVLFDGGNENLIRDWQHQYLTFLKQVQYTQPGKQLLLKNPANTARIQLLKKQFPKAKFIHLHRDPYNVFASTVHLYLKAQKAWGLQKTSREAVVEQVLSTYPKLMQSYLEQKDTLPDRDLIEIRFADLQTRPLQTLENIYDHLGLPGFTTAKPEFSSYLEKQRNYQKNNHSLTQHEKSAVEQRWKPYFETFEYQP